MEQDNHSIARTDRPDDPVAGAFAGNITGTGLDDGGIIRVV